jgi:hypothetical protein
MNIHINKNKKITGSFIIGVIIFNLVRFLLKKINKPNNFLKKRNRFKPTSFSLVWFFITKPV